jgi:2-polyprenyl-6-methoxyphenol hydroxylase-like FAD-dependent oxidoreductase
MSNTIYMRAVDVIIVGAGPTGLLLAIELAVGGVDVLVLERLSEPDQTIKAGVIGALAAEALERRGFGAAMDAEEAAIGEVMAKVAEKAGAPIGPSPWKRLAGHFAGLFLIDQTRQRQPERRLRGMGQQSLERMLGERTREMAIVVERGVEVVDHRQEADSVIVRARTASGDVEVRCAYLVGCDGGRSTTRKRAGFDFPGTDPVLTGHQAIIELDHPERLLPLGWRRTATGVLAFGPLPGRVLTVEFDCPPSDRDAPVTIAEVQESLQKVSGADVRVTAMPSATRFTDNARQATSYRMGRVLLAGDAAHVHSPFGGQGLNLGLLDAVNLGWKLAAVIRGEAGEDLLDTYTSERHPVAARVLANTRAQVALMRLDPLTSALRDIVAELMKLDEGNRFFGEMISGIRTRYDLDVDDARVGTFCRNLALDGGVTLFGVMQDGRGVLLDAAAGEAAAVAQRWSPGLKVASSPDGTSILVRPDGCIAWAADDRSVTGLETALRRWFGVHAHMETQAG